MVDQLHMTHLSYQGMRGLAKNKFFWPGMTSVLEKKSRGCEQCKIDSISHHEKAHQVVPENLLFLAPGKQISIDFGIYNNKSMLDRTRCQA